MTGLEGHRVYLDWNATAPLRPEARAAMLEAMDVVGNPSSVHAEGRAAKKIIEKARGQVAALVGCEPSEVVFTSGATEALNMVISGAEWDAVLTSEIEHEAVAETIDRQFPDVHRVRTHNGYIGLDHVTEHALEVVGEAEPHILWHYDRDEPQLLEGTKRLVAFQAINSETGISHDLSRFCIGARDCVAFLSDLTQLAHRQVWHQSRRETASDHAYQNSYTFAAVSAHKMGGPAGIGGLIVRGGGLAQNKKGTGPSDLAALLLGGGQEQGRRSGTENVIGIAGFGAAAEAAQRDLEAGVWEPVENLRNLLEDRLAEAAPDTIFFGKDAARLPNTSCFAVPGWKGETQVMQMDLSGFAVSAGSACSSGKVNKASRVLLAMGFDEITASSAIRVSMGPTTTEAEVMAFADAWIDAYRRRKARAA